MKLFIKISNYIKDQLRLRCLDTHIPATTTTNIVESTFPPFASPFCTNTPPYQNKIAQQLNSTHKVKPSPRPLTTPLRYPILNVCWRALM